MQLISTDYRDYLAPTRAPSRPLRERAVEHGLKPATRVIGYFMVAMGITFIGWGAGFDSAWVLGVLFAYPITESFDWAVAARRTSAAPNR